MDIATKDHRSCLSDSDMKSHEIVYNRFCDLLQVAPLKLVNIMSIVAQFFKGLKNHMEISLFILGIAFRILLTIPVATVSGDDPN